MSTVISVYSFIILKNFAAELYYLYKIYKKNHNFKYITYDKIKLKSLAVIKIQILLVVKIK